MAEGLAARLHTAAQQGDLLSLQACLAAGADPHALLPLDPWGGRETALHVAARQRNCECVAGLLAAGGSPSAAASNGWTPVHAATFFRQGPALGLLLAAQPEAALVRNHVGQLPLLMTLSADRAAVGLLLLRAGAPPPLREALSLLWQCSRSTDIWAHRLYAALAARQALTEAQWAWVPAPCAALAGALPAVLQRSAAEARLLVAHLPAADAERLHMAALCLGRAQRLHAAELPSPVVWRLLALAAAG